MIHDERAIAAWVASRCEEHRSEPGGIVPRAPTQEDLENFGARFLGESNKVREGPVTRTVFHMPTAAQVGLIQAAWTRWRVQRFGPAAAAPPKRRLLLPRAVRALLGEE